MGLKILSIMTNQLPNFNEPRYIAGMVLSGVGDALGFRNGLWEFCSNGSFIQQQLVQEFECLGKLHVKCPSWTVSDDTVMHLATAEALVSIDTHTEKLPIYKAIAREYKSCMSDMKNRSPGRTCIEMCAMLDPDNLPGGLCIPFNTNGGGCGAAMRSMCIGLRYPHPDEIDNLIAVSIEAGRLTHHHPTGYFGSLASALFTSYSVQGKPLKKWGKCLLKILKKSKKYIKRKSELYTEKDVIKQNRNHRFYFKQKWKKYLRIKNGKSKKGKKRYDTEDTEGIDAFYKYLSYDGVGGASGHDAPMIAYDALLECDGDWEKLCKRAMFHGGDSDSTGVIAGCLYGVIYGFDRVSPCNYEDVEFYQRMKNAAEGLYKEASKKRLKKT